MAELSGQGPILHSGATSVIDTAAACKLGTRARDVDGNEYVYVDFQESCIRGEWVSFGATFLAFQLTATSVGWVGVVDGTVSASDRFGWVLVYGVHTAAWATSGSSSGAPVVIAATTDLGHIATDASSAQTIKVYGVLVATSPDTCASTALSTSALAAPATVILNYPFVDQTQISTS